MQTKQRLKLFKLRAVDGGFTMTENLVSLIILSITLAAMLPAFMSFGMQNAKNRQLSGATAVANNLMSDLRRQPMNDLNSKLGKTVLTNVPGQNGDKYQVDQYICTKGTTLNPANPAGTCSTTVGENDFARQILLEVKAPNNPNETIYRVQTVFARLRIRS
ncbi:type II secretion system protein [Synechocystis sp. PCC 7339]|uniref:type IV pilus modification PilV family protein n=1 Tax=unclassified Synechocystis TaxID=2640012 RepID=UPI001BB08461|nr:MULTISPECIES: type II secretion system protein [unclassified Synechocystis]QUS59489.1 type II secretion system protein [Synechocystis sp. PCC 7338]UAJ71674.1 type II secretion system protein [Synechocystis sp. PCC 7339]